MKMTRKLVQLGMQQVRVVSPCNNVFKDVSTNYKSSFGLWMVKISQKKLKEKLTSSLKLLFNDKYVCTSVFCMGPNVH